MQTDAFRLWLTRIVTFTLSGLAAASAAYWGLKGWGPMLPSTAPTVLLAQATPADEQAVARALGGAQVSAAPASDAQATDAISRFALVGVLAGRSHKGAALISVDGQEAKPVRVGGLVDEGVTLQSVTGRRAVLSSGAGNTQAFTLELPLLND
jgi:general secretion pathway protein C